MPVAAPIQEKAKQAVGTPESANYQQAQSVVAGAGTLSEAVEAGNFLDGLEEAHQREARAVLAALPDDVDRAFMDALKAALGAGAKVEFAWEDSGDDTFGHRSSTAADGTVRLVLVTPNGSRFT